MGTNSNETKASNAELQFLYSNQLPYWLTRGAHNVRKRFIIDFPEPNSIFGMQIIYLKNHPASFWLLLHQQFRLLLYLLCLDLQF